MKSRIEQAKKHVEQILDSALAHAFRLQELTAILNAYRDEWYLPMDFGQKKFLRSLLDSTDLREVELRSEQYSRVEKRYLWKNPSVYSVALSLRKGSYLTHGSAVFIHGLTDEIPKTVYLNYEQSKKPTPAGHLTQEGIDRAFAGRQRQSNLVYDCKGYQIAILSGKHTGRLEVSTVKGDNDELLEVTKLERTLIDITVRPVYAGGVVQVLEAFKTAKDKISVNTLVATLKKLDYIYPYQQAIGFYMERTGYSERQWSRLLKLKSSFDFYLAHGLPAKKNYDKKWGLYCPDGL